MVSLIFADLESLARAEKYVSRAAADSDWNKDMEKLKYAAKGALWALKDSATQMDQTENKSASKGYLFFIASTHLHIAVISYATGVDDCHLQ